MQAKIRVVDTMASDVQMKNPLLLFVVLVSAAIPVHAHVPGAELTGFLGGFAHSLFGADHLLAALAVGCLAGWGADRSRWMLPVVFVGSMTIGLGTAGVSTVLVTEALIALSVVALGLLIARGAPVRSKSLIALVGVFAWFHGQAHGAALTHDLNAVSFASGVVASTALLHAIGFFAAVRLEHSRARAGLRAGGIGMALAGVMWAVAVV